MAFILTSERFGDGQPIPARNAPDGENLSPPLQWADPPEGTRSYALLMEDVDMPGTPLRHWGLYHLAGGRTMLPEGVEAGAATEDLGFCENDLGTLKYEGPAPPEGAPPHTYVFRLAALGTERLTQAPRLPAAEMWQAAQPHILAVAELTGTYAR